MKTFAGARRRSPSPDRSAGRVYRMPARADPAIRTMLRAPPAAPQRACAGCEVEKQVQRAAAAPGRAGGDVSATVASGTASGGTPLPATARNHFESRFGRDFGDVRVHTGPEAAASAEALNAHAYTLGRDVVFNAGRYDPAGAAGQRLLAHELAHVVQQGAAASAHGVVQRDDKPPSFPKTGAQIVGSEAADLVTILEGCSGMDLDLAKGGALTIKSEGDAKKAKSAAARAAVKAIVSAKSGVIINADPASEATQVGAFSHEHPGLQTLDISNIKVLAAASGAKGGVSACDMVLHEMSEAVAGRKLALAGKLKGEDLFLAAHAEGEKTEKAIRKDLGLPERSAAGGDMVHFANESADVMLLLDSMVFGSGKNVHTQISVVRFKLGPIVEKGGEKTRSGDNNVIASHVVKGEVRFKTDMEAIKVFNTYAKDFGFQPITVPEKKK